ncbi:hypothetical protein [Mariniblastus fucicola]|uniref:Uncharacterized protein n=1 Tax=Mariniblastus fucicola TaxID=980251 RepID=A0A5B9P4I0_9BACT|nr:hypothetical protein [Mariniblastus fucicola]QEG20429.1 hypothetical protein MFFC18_02770 [Mariniblastus fucicola]
MTMLTIAEPAKIKPVYRDSNVDRKKLSRPEQRPCSDDRGDCCKSDRDASSKQVQKVGSWRGCFSNTLDF